MSPPVALQCSRLDNKIIGLTTGRGKFQMCLASFLPMVAARAEVRRPAIFADRMLIQRDVPVHVWGTASAGEAVAVNFRGETGRTVADELGRWSLYLKSGAAGGPFQLEVQGTNRIVLDDVLAGDLWIASGQSNMEFAVSKEVFGGVINESEEVAAAKYPRIRQLDLKPRSSGSPQDDISIRHPWTAVTPATAGDYSAVGYFFARELQKHENVPIGVIDATWGGTPAEAWTSLDALSSDASLMPVFARRARLMNELGTQLLQTRKEKTEYDTAIAAGKPAPPLGWVPDPESWKPAGLYNAMIAPLTAAAIKGVIWYQGESNSDPDTSGLYARLFSTMIQDWRVHWGEGDFPLLFVQIANWNPGELFPEIREAQRHALVLKNTAMAVTIDVGGPDDIHPRNKQAVGLRLSLAARAIAYGERIEYSGLIFREATMDGSVLRLRFDHAESGLTSRNGELRGFAVAGAVEKYVLAQAQIDGDTVVVSSPSVSAPMYVRYGWAANPDCNLYNRADLPASPFQAKALR